MNKGGKKSWPWTTHMWNKEGEQTCAIALPKNPGITHNPNCLFLQGRKQHWFMIIGTLDFSKCFHVGDLTNFETHIFIIWTIRKMWIIVEGKFNFGLFQMFGLTIYDQGITIQTSQ
jgi:hypothetical protein